MGVARGGLTTGQGVWSVYRTKGGRVARQDQFTSEEEALKALADARSATG